MKTLILLRHAKSSWDDTTIVDFERPLNARGHAAARLVGRSLRSDGACFDGAVVSPAARAIETWEGILQAYGPAPDPHFDPAVYLASPATLLDIIRAAREGVERLLVIGHNPGMEQLALMLSRPDDPRRARLQTKFPTGARVEIELPAERWLEVAEGSGTIRRFVTPRDLAGEED